MAVILLFLGEHGRALEHFEKSLSGFTGAGDHAAPGKTLNNLGDCTCVAETWNRPAGRSRNR